MVITQLRRHRKWWQVQIFIDPDDVLMMQKLEDMLAAGIVPCRDPAKALQVLKQHGLLGKNRYIQVERSSE